MTRLSKPLTAALLAGLVIAGQGLALPAIAQNSSSQSSAQMPSANDLRALRFYIQQNQTAAVNAEIARLQRTFPGWTPPSNLNELLVTSPSNEVSDIYARISRGDVDGARSLIQQTQQRYPTWEPPADLEALLNLTSAQQQFDNAVAQRNLSAARTLVSQNSGLLRCDRINNIWNLAKMQEEANNDAGAYATYQQIVNTCNDVPQLVSTIEKADSVTSQAQLTGLVSTAKSRFPGQQATFDTLQTRLLAGRGVTTAAPTTTAKTTTTTRRTTTTTVAAAPRRTTTTSSAPSTTVVRRSSEATSPDILRLPTRGDSRLSSTRAAAKAGNWAECLARSANPRSVEIGYERAWCAYNLDRPLEALAYFNLASDGRLGSTVARDARFGMALSMLKRNMTDSAARVAASTNFTTEQRREIEGQILNQRGVRAYNTDDYRKSIDYFDALEQMNGSLTRDLALLRGYAYLNLGDRDKARSLFQTLNDQLSTEESRAALKATY